MEDSSSSSSSCAACVFMHKECTADCEMRHCFPLEALANFALLTHNFGAPENVVRMVKDVTPDQRLDFIKSLEFETHCRIIDPVHGSLGRINLELEMSKLLKEQLEYLKKMSDTVAANEHKGENVEKFENKLNMKEDDVAGEDQV